LIKVNKFSLATSESYKDERDSSDLVIFYWLRLDDLGKIQFGNLEWKRIEKTLRLDMKIGNEEDMERDQYIR
jgi:hypothetical protein